jgi:hypothetical protein
MNDETTLYSGIVDDDFLPHGFGVCQIVVGDGAEGDMYSGQFQHGELDGVGIYTSSNGGWRRFGLWSKGYLHGVGDINSADGDSYSGQFESNKKHGFGTYTFKDGSQYIGEYDCDLRHGHGLIEHLDATKTAVEYVAGDVISATAGLGTKIDYIAASLFRRCRDRTPERGRNERFAVCPARSQDPID